MASSDGPISIDGSQPVRYGQITGWWFTYHQLKRIASSVLVNADDGQLRTERVASAYDCAEGDLIQITLAGGSKLTLELFLHDVANEAFFCISPRNHQELDHREEVKAG